MDSAIEDSDTPIYDWNSDDEPPTDVLLDPVAVCADGSIHKRVLHIGSGFNKPSWGDRITALDILKHEEMIIALSVGQIPKNLETVWDEEFGSNITALLGYTCPFAYGLEQTIRTMKRGERCIVNIPKDSIYSNTIPNSHSVEKKNERYEIIHKEQMKKQKAAIRRARRANNKLRQELATTTFTPSNNISDQDQTMSYYKNEFNKTKNQSSLKDVSALTSYESISYIIELVSFTHRIALVDDRSIIKEISIPAPTYRQRARSGDLITYQLGCGCKETKKTCYLTPENVGSINLYKVLMSMREGERCEAFYTNYQNNDNKQNVELLKVLRVDQVIVHDIEYPNREICNLKAEEIISYRSGLKQQQAVEDGCHILVFITIIHQKQLTKNMIFPFKCVESNPRHTVTAGFASWTVGRCLVPFWMDAIVRILRPGQRIRVSLPISKLSQTLNYNEALKTSFDLTETTRTPYIQSDYIKMDHAFIVTTNDAVEKEVVEHWSNNAITLKDFGTPPPPIDIVNILSKTFIQHQWNIENSSSEHIALLRTWVNEHSQLAVWDTDCFSIKNDILSQNDTSDLLLYPILDIQLIDVVGRLPAPWMISEEERLNNANILREFGNFVLKKGLFNLALKIYENGIELLRFCEDSNPVCTTTNQQGLVDQQMWVKKSIVVQELLKKLRGNRGAVFLRLKMWREAIIATEEAQLCSHEPELKYCFRIAQAAYELDDWKRVKLEINICNQIEPNNPDVKKLTTQLNQNVVFQREAQKKMFGKMFQSIH